MRGRMQKQIQLAFAGYNESNVKTAVKTIVTNSPNFNIVVKGNAIKEDGLIINQPNLRGCDNKDLKIYSISIMGSLVNIRNLVKMKTPPGVQIDLLPQVA